MKSVQIELLGCAGKLVQDFTGETWNDVLLEFSRFQDLDCLVRQIHMMGSEADCASVEAFEDFVYKWESGNVAKADFATCRAALSIGHICCLSARDEEGEQVFPPWGKKRACNRRSTRKEQIAARKA